MYQHIASSDANSEADGVREKERARATAAKVGGAQLPTVWSAAKISALKYEKKKRFFVNRTAVRIAKC